MMTLYALEKDYNLSRTDSQRLIYTICNYSPNLQKCWKTMQRTFMAVADYYPIKKTIPWPKHFLMSKWNYPNTSSLDDMVIRIRDPCNCVLLIIAVIADSINLRIV